MIQNENETKSYYLSHVNEIPQSKVVLSRKVRFVLFITFILLSVVVDLDNGVIASSSSKVKKDLSISDSEYGVFVSVHFTGRIVGLLIFMALIGSDYRKTLAVSTILLHAGSLFVYLFTANKLILYFVRLFTSIMKVFCSIYMPVWIDQFGYRHHKTIMMTLAYMLSPYGHVIGFTIGTLIFPDRWAYALSFIGTIMFGIAGIFILVPSKYYSSKYLYIGYEEGIERLVLAKKFRHKTSIFAEADVLKKSLQTMNENDNSKEKEKEKSNFNPFNFCILFTSGSYVFCALTRANLFFIFQVIHLFIKDYIINGLQLINQEKILYYYGLASIIGPPLGSFVGGLISNRLGGYESRRSILVCIIFGILTCILVIPLSFCSQLETFSLSLALFFVCTSALLPTLTGYTISSAPKELKGAGTSIDMLVTTIIGKMPGPIIYGILNDRYKNTSPRLAWTCCLFYYYVGFACMMIACCFRWNALRSNTTDGLNKKAIMTREVSIYVSEVLGGEKSQLMDSLKSEPLQEENNAQELSDKKSNFI